MFKIKNKKKKINSNPFRKFKFCQSPRRRDCALVCSHLTKTEEEEENISLVFEINLNKTKSHSLLSTINNTNYQKR